MRFLLSFSLFNLTRLCVYSSKALNKKEHKNGLQSPDSPDNEPEYSLTPRTEAKYNRIDEEFSMMIQKNQINGSRVRRFFFFFVKGFLKI